MRATAKAAAVVVAQGPSWPSFLLGFVPGLLQYQLGQKKRAAVAFGARRWSVIRKVLLPSALPMIFAGLKLGAGTALLLLVAAEMIAVESGIGFLVLHAGNVMETTKLMVGIVVLSLLGVASHWMLTRLERVVVPWRHD